MSIGADCRRRASRYGAVIWLSAALLAGAGVGAASPHRPAGKEPGRAADPGAELRVTLLGTGNPRPSIDRFGPAILVEAGSRRILVDAGRGATIRLFQVGRGELVAGIDLLLLTHLHSDHVVGLPDLWLTGWIFGRDRPLEVYGPRGTKAMMRHLERAFDFDVTMRRDIDERFPAAGIEVRARDVAPGIIMERDGLRIEAFVVDHRPVKPAYGYRFDYRGRSLVISGDTRPSPTLVEKSRGVDVLIHEVVSPEVERRRSEVADPERTQRIIDHHTTPRQAGEIFSAVRPRLAVYSHIVPSPTRPEDLIPPTREAWGGRLEVGYDLMMITIGERIEVNQRAVAAER